MLIIRSTKIVYYLFGLINFNALQTSTNKEKILKLLLLIGEMAFKDFKYVCKSIKYSLLNKNEKIAQKFFGSRTWVHKKTFRSSSCIPTFNQNKNELKIKTKVKLYSQKIKL